MFLQQLVGLVLSYPWRPLLAQELSCQIEYLKTVVYSHTKTSSLVLKVQFLQLQKLFIDVLDKNWVLVNKFLKNVPCMT